MANFCITNRRKCLYNYMIWYCYGEEGSVIEFGIVNRHGGDEM